MGIHVRVYRDSGPDCTNDGISARHDTLTVTNIDGPDEPTADAPGVILVAGPTAGQGANPILVPEDGSSGSMYGGNIASSSDSRWSAAVRAAGGTTRHVSIHDRFEH